MPVQITVDVFSGRPNPVVTLPAPLIGELFSRAAPLAERAAPAVANFPRLGYRGLLVEHNEPQLAEMLPPVARLYRGVLHAHATVALPGIEGAFLAPGGVLDLAGMPQGLREFIAAGAERALAAPSPAMLAASTPAAAPSLAGTVPGAEQAPLFEPDWWNDGAIKQAQNNCYNYATDYRTDTFALPGRAAGSTITTVSCDQILPFAVADDLISDPPNNNEFPAVGHLVALVMAQGFDFHWYRKGQDGMWSHKIGPLPVTNVDNAGVPIADPRVADRGPYQDFCGFLVVMHGHIKLQ